MNSSCHDSVHVLLVEDDHEDYEITRDLLDEIQGEQRFQLDWVTRYEEALALMRRGEHAVCLLDFHLQARTGLELLSEANGLGVETPVIFLTGRGDAGIERQALGAGAADYLIKGDITAESLARSIRHSLERGRSVRALRERERQFRSVFEGALDAMLLADDEARFLDGNQAALALLGVSRAKLLTLEVFDVASSEVREVTESLWKAFLAEGRMEGEFRLRRPDGKHRDVEYRATAGIMPGRHLTVLRDITERKATERQRLRLAAMVESAVDAIGGLTLDGHIDYWSPAAERLFGYTAAEVLGRSTRLLLPADRLSELDEMLARVLEGQAWYHHDTQRCRKDGTTFDASVTVSPVLHEGAIVAASVITRDISERKQLEAHLALSDRMASVGTLAAGVAHEINNPLAIVTANLDIMERVVARAGRGLESRASEAFAPLARTGWSQRSPASPGHALCLYESESALVELVSRHLAAGAALGEPLLVITTGIRRDGLCVHLDRLGVDVDHLSRRQQLIFLDSEETLAELLVDGTPCRERFNERVGTVLGALNHEHGGAPIRAFGDMVDLLLRQQRVDSVDRLEALWDELATGHGLSLLCAQSLTGFRGADELQHICADHGQVLLAEDQMQRKLGGWKLAHAHELVAEISRRKANEVAFHNLQPAAGQLDQLREPLADAIASAARIRHVVRDLRVFSRPDEESRGPVDLRTVLESALRMARNEIRHRARIVRNYGDTLPVEGNEARLGQVFLNLIINAAHSIREGDVAHNEIRLVTFMDQQGAVVAEVRDTGSGISQAAKQRLFEPFFTTKPIGVGTGLGLSICRRIVQEHHGSIDVESEQGKGSTFRITLPAARRLQATTPVPEGPVPDSGERARILLIDDEPLVVAALERHLRSKYEIVSCTSAGQALELILGGAQFDLLLCDMMMPQVTGMDFYEVLSSVAPELLPSVVFLTGGAFTPAAREFLKRVPNRQLEKPFDLSQLESLINDRFSA